MWSLNPNQPLIPEHVLFRIFDYCSPVDLCSFAKTGRTGRDAVKNFVAYKFTDSRLTSAATKAVNVIKEGRKRNRRTPHPRDLTRIEEQAMRFFKLSPLGVKLHPYFIRLHLYAFALKNNHNPLLYREYCKIYYSSPNYTSGEINFTEIGGPRHNGFHLAFRTEIIPIYKFHSMVEIYGMEKKIILYKQAAWADLSLKDAIAKGRQALFDWSTDNVENCRYLPYQEPKEKQFVFMTPRIDTTSLKSPKVFNVSMTHGSLLPYSFDIIGCKERKSTNEYEDKCSICELFL